MQRAARGRTAVVMVVALWAIQSGCSDSPASPAATGIIAGAVRDGATGVPGATLALSGSTARTATSSATGTFRFTDLAAGSYTVAITVPSGFLLAGGEASSKSVTVTAGQTASVDFAVSAASAGNIVTVNTVGLTFSPATLRVARGTTVRWVNNSTFHHTVTPNGHSEWSNADLPEGTSFEHTFNTAGTFNYFCTPHQASGMAGSVQVE